MREDKRQVATIVNEFLDQQQLSDKYLRHLAHSLSISLNTVSEMVDTLQHFGVEFQDSRIECGGQEQCPIEILLQLHTVCQSVRASLDQEICLLAELTKAHKYSIFDRLFDTRADDVKEIEYKTRSIACEIRFAPELLYIDPLPVATEEACIREFQRAAMERGFASITEAEAKRFVRLGLGNARQMQIAGLEIFLANVDKVDGYITAYSGGNAHDPLRQLFVALMAYYDAAISDLFKIALGRDFFGLVKIGARNDNATVDLNNFESFDDLRQIFIRDHTKTGLTTLLQVFESDTAFDFDKSCGYTKVSLIEIVNRRNIHVHNRGFADEKYVARSNIYGLKLGDYAPITDEYMTRANAILRQSLEQAGVWVDSLPKVRQRAKSPRRKQPIDDE